MRKMSKYPLQREKSEMFTEYSREVSILTVLCHDILAQTLESNGVTVKRLVMGITIGYTCPRLWKKETVIF
jgi:hypothetical protein